jgi:hypothetical protein
MIIISIIIKIEIKVIISIKIKIKVIISIKIKIKVIITIKIEIKIKIKENRNNKNNKKLTLYFLRSFFFRPFLDCCYGSYFFSFFDFH